MCLRVLRKQKTMQQEISESRNSARKRILEEETFSRKIKRTTHMQKIITSQARSFEGLASHGESGVRLAQELLNDNPMDLQDT